MTEMVQNVVRDGSSVYDSGLLWPEYKVLGKWHRSKEKKGGVNPFMSFMLNKKWTLEEDFTNHMLRFQQVSLSSITSIN